MEALPDKNIYVLYNDFMYFNEAWLILVWRICSIRPEGIGVEVLFNERKLYLMRPGRRWCRALHNETWLLSLVWRICPMRPG